MALLEALRVKNGDRVSAFKPQLNHFLALWP